VIANLTAVAPTAGTYLVAYPANVLKPNASDLNLVAGAILPNLVVVQLDTVAGANDGALYPLQRRRERQRDHRHRGLVPVAFGPVRGASVVTA